MELLWLGEVLIVDVASAGRVNSNEVVLSIILNECVTENFPKTRVQCCNLLDCGGLFLLSDPIVWVTTTTIFTVCTEAVF